MVGIAGDAIIILVLVLVPTERAQGGHVLRQEARTGRQARQGALLGPRLCTTQYSLDLDYN